MYEQAGKSPSEPLSCGDAGVVVLAVDEDGSVPAQAFMESLDNLILAGFFVLFDSLVSGRTVCCPERICYLEPDVIQLRVHNVSLVCVRQGYSWAVVHGFCTNRKSGRQATFDVSSIGRFRVNETRGDAL